EKAGKAPPKVPEFRRQESFPFDRYGEIQAGDWLFYYNGNASTGGGHSVIFSHWTSEIVVTPKGVRYRAAKVFSQGRPEQGGRMHDALLGDQYADNPNGKKWLPIVPVTWVSRVTPDTAPATTAAALAGDPAANKRRSAENEKFIKAKETASRGTLDRDRLVEWLRDQNTQYVTTVFAHLSLDQVRLAREANESGELEALVRLNQRLHALAVNAWLLDRNEAAHYERVNRKYADEKAKSDAAQGKAEAEIAGIDQELGWNRTDLEELQRQRAELDLDPEIRKLKTDLAGIVVRKGMTKEQRDNVPVERKKKLEEIAAARKAQAEPDRVEKLRGARAELATLEKRKKALETKRAAQEKTRAAAAGASMPFGTVHAGSVTGQEKGGTTGRLADLKPQPDWKSLIIPLPPAPPAPAKPKAAKKK
ncbi:MAG TPA: hypothetical protein VF705_08645, partial [Longimicrobium sp.]